MKTIDTVLRDTAPFHCLPPSMLEVVAGCAKNVHFAADQVLFRAGEAADTFYLVRGGSVALETYVPGRGGLLIDTANAGEVVGWSWLFAPYRWHFDARALSDVRATAFDGACLRGKCEEDPALGYELMSCFAQVMIERLQWTQLRLVDVYGNGRDR